MRPLSTEAPTAPPTDPALDRATEINSLALQAYVYGYPLVALERTRRLLTSKDLPIGVPVNTFLHVDRLMTPRSREVVKPNNDTLYSSAFLDLRSGPLLLDVSDTRGRYYSLTLFDAYTNAFAYVGRRTTGTRAGRYVITGPGRHGPLPDLPVLAAATDSVWLLGRTLVDGPDDLDAAGDTIRRYALTTLQGTPPPSAPHEGAVLSPQGLGTCGIGFFDEMCAGLALNPPPATDQPVLDRIGRLGLGPGRVPSREVTDPVVRAALATVGVSGDALLNLPPGAPGDVTGRGAARHNGWSYHLNTGSYGQCHLVRAGIALQGLGAVHPEEALYVTARTDPLGRSLDGGRRYLLRFEPGRLPPVDAFWSLTAYDHEQYLIDNPLGRYSLGDRTPGLVYSDDGSLEVRIQHEEPEGGPSNWLPVGPDRFELTVRCYQPHAPLLDGRYLLPPLVVLDEDPRDRR
ncbi:DUF1254 domain-containing protein [Streptomyces sp. NBC_00687]|uniref:DUF1254 domain-containing protein n=1 Tax=Streptomyces sp. NBC_00687 TaxID=2975807 RepID=UPI002259C39C|nr:DUF1254 domain-containing protein [Streptomyces sp. NBC_00687]MCX4919042.1 DUF1254 domain-containing protein [Streptomyces sp. NBC_00687]